MNVFFHQRLSEFCTVVLTGRNTYAHTFQMSRLVNHLVHGTCLD